jgi:hypothetical protein
VGFINTIIITSYISIIISILEYCCCYYYYQYYYYYYYYNHNYNPPPLETREGRIEPSGKPYQTEDFELRFQRGGGRGPACHGTVNSGQMWFRNTTGVQKFFELMEVRG